VVAQFSVFLNVSQPIASQSGQLRLFIPGPARCVISGRGKILTALFDVFAEHSLICRQLRLPDFYRVGRLDELENDCSHYEVDDIR
jgi:hypothetical protein